MASLTTKDFLKLLDQSVLEIQSSNEVEIIGQTNEDFKFTYYFKEDSITALGDIQLTGDQEKQLRELAFNYYQDNAPEDAEGEYTTDYYSMYGVNNQMFI